MKLAKVPGSVWAAAKFSIAEGLDRNSGSVVPAWDRLAGSPVPSHPGGLAQGVAGVLQCPPRQLHGNSAVIPRCTREGAQLVFKT